MGIFVNITDHRASKEQPDQLRSQTLRQARELLDHQVEVAQSLAKFLGESTARGEALLEKLVVLAGEPVDAAGEEERTPWPQDTFTSTRR